MQSKNRTHRFSTSAFPGTSNPQALSLLDRGRQVHLAKIQKDAEIPEEWCLFALAPSSLKTSNAISSKSLVHP